jgi:glycosyltransferase involved in cell wall biosynthesis
MDNNKIVVNFFQRKPRKGFSFSLEYIFEDIRCRLEDKIDTNVYISKCFNDGYFTKIINVLQAAFRQKKDINHITGEVHFLNLLMRKSRVVLTILDCGMMVRKQGIAQNIIKWLYLKLPVLKAEIVTAISEETKKEIILYTNCNPNKIVVIPVAVHPQYQPVTKIFNKIKPVILQIGTGYNKNLLRLIEALSGINCHLTIVGKLGDEHLAALKYHNTDFSNEYNISNERLIQKYIECDMLSFISTFEGFGMPIIEANAVERVVVTSNISSMPEVANNAACLVNPLDVNDMRAGILKVINDDNFRATLINNGRINKLRFDPTIIANKYYELYREIYDAAIN